MQLSGVRGSIERRPVAPRNCRRRAGPKSELPIVRIGSLIRFDEVLLKRRLAGRISGKSALEQHLIEADQATDANDWKFRLRAGATPTIPGSDRTPLY